MALGPFLLFQMERLGTCLPCRADQTSHAPWTYLTTGYRQTSRILSNAYELMS